MKCISFHTSKTSKAGSQKAFSLVLLFTLYFQCLGSTCPAASHIDNTVVREQYSYSGGYTPAIFNVKAGYSTGSLYYYIRLHDGSSYTSAIMKETSSGAIAWNKHFLIYPLYKNFHVARNEQYV